MKSRHDRMDEILALSPVVPVLKFTDKDTAIAVSRALVDGGLPVIEITLRTPAALDCIRAVARNVEGAVVGAGTVLTREMAEESVEMGAQFLVSPGSTVGLLDSQRKSATPLLPGVSTPSEAMALLTDGYHTAKFFPAENSGGTGRLKAFGSVFPDLKFCPTGGLDAAKAVDYLALPNVVCVGGSWVAPDDLVAAGDYDAITRLATEAAALGT